MLHPCPSCGTKCKVSSEAALERARCPRCGAALADAAEPSSSGRTTVVLVVFAACLLIPLAIALPLLLSGSGDPDPSTPPPRQVAQGNTPPRHGLPVDPPGGHGRPVDTTQPPGGLIPVEPNRPTTPPGHGGDTQPVAPPRLDPFPPREDEGKIHFPTFPVEPPPPVGKDGGPVVMPADPKKPNPQDPPTRPVVPPKAKDKGQHVSFMGAVGTGRRFCIIADNSGSMSGTPLQVLKYELGRTLQSLQANSEFYIIFFNSKAVPQPTPGWTRGVTDVSGAWLWIQSVNAGGTTRPTVGFEVAFQLKPRPDAIFFMTDGKIPQDVPQAVLAMNNQAPRVPIHTILFTKLNLKSPPEVIQGVVGPMQAIAFQSGGTFGAVPVPASAPQMPKQRPPKK